MQVNESRFPVSLIPAANVASVPQRSPLRYPGGKTWLIPHIRVWLDSQPNPPRLLVEPFCGGGIVSLTAIAEDRVGQCLMSDIDQEVVDFWQAALCHGPKLCKLIADFEPSREIVTDLEVDHGEKDLVRRGFRTLVLNRTRRGGILAPGASLINSGENGKGIASRWYPETLINRLEEIRAYADKITFRKEDGIDLLEKFVGNKGVVVFADPPYVSGGKRAGSRLYRHSDIDHKRLFEILADSGVEFLMTYDASTEVSKLIEDYNFYAVTVAMKNTHHARIPELVITNRPVFHDE